MSEQRSTIEQRCERLRDILLYIRRILGWSAVKLGEKLGVSRQSINKIESGKSSLSKTEYLLLRRVLDDEIAATDNEHAMLSVVLEVLVDHPEKYQQEERDEVFAKMKLVAPAVIAEPEERENVSTSWKSILLAGGVIVTATLVALLKENKDDEGGFCMSKKILKGAAATTHGLKEYGHGISMEAGLKRLQAESRRDGFQQGVNYALQRLSLTERILGRQLGNGRK